MLLLLLGSALVTILMLIREHVALRATGLGPALFLLGLLLCAALRHGCRRPANERQRIARDFGEYVAVFAVMAMIGAIASYPDAAATSGLVDPELQRADRLLHFDWAQAYHCVAAHRSLQVCGVLAYQSIFLTPAVLLGHYAWTNRREEAYRFLLSFWLAAVTTLTLFRSLPAAGPLALLPRGSISYMPQSALYQAQLIPALQHHGPRIVDLDALHGLVSAPSFHAASGMLYILFARRAPLVGPPLIVLSLFMMAATPVEGTHYLVDIIGGVAVAAMAYAATGLRRMRPIWTAPLTPAPQG